MTAATTRSETTSQTTLTGPATAQSAAALRQRLSTWLHDQGAPPALVIDTTIGTNEALANCVDHAYGGRRQVGEMTVRVGYDSRTQSISVCITDRGTWRPPVPCDLHDTRGRGVALMYALADHCTINGRADGTTVCLDYHSAPTSPRP
jgi:serine/threonine-protein kinase RsbW